MTIKDYLSGPITYDHQWGHVQSGAKNILMVRGWSSISESFNGDVTKTDEFQQKVGEFIAEAIKEKLEKL